MAWLGLFITVFGLGGYMVGALWFARYGTELPWGWLSLALFGAALSSAAAITTRRALPSVAAVLSVAILAMGGWWLFEGSSLGEREDRPRVGDPFPEFALPASDGVTFEFRTPRSKPSLILFYRGDW